MGIEEARAKHNGIDFSVPHKNLILCAKYDENGNVIVEKRPKKLKSQNVENTLVKIIIVLFISFLLSAVLNYVHSARAQVIIIVSCMWALTFLYYIFKSQKHSKYQTYRYHAAEHKALNYFDKYEKAPMEVSDIKKMPSTSVRCGSTLIAVFYVIFTLSALGIVFWPMVWLKVVWCIVSLIITFFLWALDLLNFFQKFVIREPTIIELEVAFEGIKAYAEEIAD